MNIFCVYYFYFTAWHLSDESDKMVYRKQFAIPLPSFKVLPETLHGTLNEFSSRSTKVIPIALALIRTQTSNVSDKLKFLFDFSWNWLPDVWHTHNQYISNNVRTGLTPDEYQNMLKHINTYIDTIVDKKIENFENERLTRDQTIDPKLSVYIANIVKEYIIQHKYVLTDEDIERIANILRTKLATEFEKQTKPFVLSQENLEEISRVVKQNIEIHRHEWIIQQQNRGNDETEAEKMNLDIEEILFKILTSNQLQDVIDKRVDTKTSVYSIHLTDHEKAIELLRNDMNDLKGKLKSIFNLNDETKISFENLQSQQNEFSDRIAMIQNENKQQIDRLLQDIDIKLNDFNDKQSLAIDNHIRIILSEIFDYKSSDGKPLKNAEIVNWIRNIFVAKDLLEKQLSELNAKFEYRLNDEIEHSAGILIRNISEMIKHDIAIAIDANQKQEKSSISHGEHISLDEKRIRGIIKEALAVYDADKTGIVDYALESSGGEVISTRYQKYHFNLLDYRQMNLFNKFSYVVISSYSTYRCTENFQVKPAEISIFGIPLWYKSNTPRSVISPSMQPGECWAFQAFPGYLVLKLSHNVYVTGFTLEHIPKRIAANGKIDSAPKTFTVWVSVCVYFLSQ